MTRAELRDAVAIALRESPKSWVMAGMAFKTLAPHILEELDRRADLFDLSSTSLDEEDGDTLASNVE